MQGFDHGHDSATRGKQGMYPSAYRNGSTQVHAGKEVHTGKQVQSPEWHQAASQGGTRSTSANQAGPIR